MDFNILKICIWFEIKFHVHIRLLYQFYNEVKLFHIRYIDYSLFSKIILISIKFIQLKPILPSVDYKVSIVR